MSEEKDLAGLRGWLILVGIGIIFSPLRIIVQLFPIYAEMFSGDTWNVLTTPGSETYNPLWAPILLTEMTVNICLVFAWIFIAFLYFSKNKLFPKWYIGILLFTIAFIVLDAFAIKTVLPNEAVFDADTSKELGRSLIVAVIWIPYMLKSKRVKATFVKGFSES